MTRNNEEPLSKKMLTVALAGNPNCGKTSIFNSLTGRNQVVGNWPGVTVERIEGFYSYKNLKYRVIDLPGIYSFNAFSDDEKVAREYLAHNQADVVLNVVDATELERSLYFTLQLIEAGLPVVVVLNMSDLLLDRNTRINTELLSKLLGCPVVETSAVSAKGVVKLQEELLSERFAYMKPKAFHYEDELETAITNISQDVQEIASQENLDARWMAIRMLEQDQDVLGAVKKAQSYSPETLNKCLDTLARILGDDADIEMAEQKYGLIQGIVRQVIEQGDIKPSMTERIDAIMLHKYLGIPLFFVIMYLVFWLTIHLGGVFIDFFDVFVGTIFVDGLGQIMSYLGSPDWLRALIADGIGGGLQTVATFIPIVFVMFFVLSILEDSGYMARAAFLVDRFMRSFGVPGKAFIPLLVGFGCTVPAIMATRTMENKRDRFLTIFMAPFMSCGARLPVYVLFAVAFFGSNAMNVVFLLYLIGIGLALITGFLLKNSLFKGERSTFIMELPKYHKPRLLHIVRHTWLRLRSFVVRAGKILVVAMAMLGFLNSMGTDFSFGNEDSENSVLSLTAKMVVPAFEPMGLEEDNWPAVVSLFTGLFAKEMVVGTLNSLYGQELAKQNNVAQDAADEEFSFWGQIGEAFVSIKDNAIGLVGSLHDPIGLGGAAEGEAGVEDGILSLMRDRFKSPERAFAFLLFILIYLPCVAATAAAYKEMGFYFLMIQVLYTTVLAWSLSVLYFQVTQGHSLLWIGTAIGLLLAMIGWIYAQAQTKNHRNRI
jgi:ferrous iron transport protein B